MSVQLGTFGAWFNPAYDDSARVRFVAEAEAVGYTTAWLGMGRRSVADLSVVERALDVTSTIVVATAIVNMWTNVNLSVRSPGLGAVGIGYTATRPGRREIQAWRVEKRHRNSIGQIL